ncbi:hypothetical protein [Catenulispora acidiphila]|nr:hypothetical protein [Catenulispora acidiphila]
MSVEDHGDGAVRGLLDSAFAGAEPPMRDLASGSIARGDAARRRNRRWAACGAVLSVLAVIGTFTAVTGATPARHRNPTPVTPATSSEPVYAPPSGPLGFGPGPASIDKMQDLKNRLPAALQPLLPAGIAFGQVGMHDDTVFINRMSGVLSGPSGSNLAAMWVGRAPAEDTAIRKFACQEGGTCETRIADGGTIYLDEHVYTAADQLRHIGVAVDALKPGTEKTVVSRSLSMLFVPADRTQYAFEFQIETAIAPIRYADRAPADVEPGIPWPPPVPEIPVSDPSGLLMSNDDLVAMLSRPGLHGLEYLLDYRTAIAPAAKAQVAAAGDRIAAAAGAALPPGVKAGIDSSETLPRLYLTGPTGTDQLNWTAFVLDAADRQREYGTCEAGDSCTRRTVPGGTLMINETYPNSDSATSSDTPLVDSYVFLPDDLSKPVLTMTLSSEPLSYRPGQPGQPVTATGAMPTLSRAPYAPLQVSRDQFLTAVENGQALTAITTTESLLAALQ